MMMNMMMMIDGIGQGRWHRTAARKELAMTIVVVAVVVVVIAWEKAVSYLEIYQNLVKSKSILIWITL